MSLLSGKIGIPDGAYTLLNKSDVERAVSWVLNNQTTIEQTIIEGGGSGNVDWARVNAAGTIIGSSGVSSASRSAEGVYLVNLTSAANSSSELGAVATPSTASGNGGSGISPYLAYDSYSAWLTDDDVDNQFVFYATDNWLIVFGENTDDLWIHDKDNWGGTPTQVAINGSIFSHPGCITMEGDALFVSKPASGADVDHVTLPGGTVTSFGAGPLGNTRRALAARTVSGSLKLWMADGGTFGRYSVALGGSPAITGPDYTVAGVDWNQTGDFKWDVDGYLWYPAVSTALHQYNYASSTKATHAYPTATPTGTAITVSAAGGNAMTYDSRRNQFYLILRSTGADHLYVFKNWTNLVDNSGTFEWVMDVGNGSSRVAIDYDADTDILYVATSAGRVIRLIGEPRRVLDTVTMPGTIPSHTVRQGCHYDGNYGYVRTDTSLSPNYIVRISYNGAEISAGDGASFIPSVLVAMATVQSASQVKVELFRSMSPIIRADGEFSVHIAKT